MNSPAPSEYSDAPPDYASVADSGGPVGLQSLDFFPQKISRNGPSYRPEYQPFKVLVERANFFLRAHPELIVNTCESIVYRMSPDHKERRDQIDPVSSEFLVRGNGASRWLRGLRLWTQRHDTQREPQQIGYHNFSPHIQDDRVLERLDDVVERINSTLVQGTLITVEALPVKWGRKRGWDPDRTIWTEASCGCRFLVVIRIFYVHGPAKESKLGLADFVPLQLPTHPDDYYPHRFDSFPVVMERVRQWLLSVPPSYKPVNVQSILVRWDQNQNLDPKDMSLYEWGTYRQYLRYIRVAYVIENPINSPTSRSNIQLWSKLIVPLILQQAAFQPPDEFETQETARARLDRWIQDTRARVLSVKTLAMRVRGGGECVYGFRAMHTWNKTCTRNSKTVLADEQFAFMYRVFMNGTGTECNDTEDTHLEEYTMNTRRQDFDRFFESDNILRTFRRLG